MPCCFPLTLRALFTFQGCDFRDGERQSATADPPGGAPRLPLAPPHQRGPGERAPGAEGPG